MTIGTMATTRLSTAAGQPGRPAALRAAGDDEVLHVHLAALLAGQELRHGVHRPDGTLDHRQPRDQVGSPVSMNLTQP